MARISERDRAHLFDTALEEVVSTTVTLKRSGGRLVGLCPFHNENSPSFTVEPSKGLFHCFGCQAGGDVFSFVQQLNPSMNFPDAVREVARIVNYDLTLEDESDEQRERRAQRARMLEANELATTFFQKWLMSTSGRHARAYLKSRGFDRDDAERFGLGYAPSDRSELVAYLSREGHAIDDLEAAGLVKRWRSGPVSFFSDRIIIPIRDASGATIAFAGRVVPVDEDDPFADPFGETKPDAPKYVNTSETMLYRKTDVLFGLDVARKEIQRRDSALMVEGYTDVMGMAKVGYGNTVATCGTAAGEGHMRVLSRFTQKLVLAFDGDDAGAAAVERAWRAAQRYKMNVRVWELPGGEDPADFAARVGTTGVEDAIRDAPHGFDWLLNRTVSQYDLDSPPERHEALQSAVKVLGDVAEPTLRDMYVDQVARAVGYDDTSRGAQAVREMAGHLGVSLVTTSVRRPTSASAVAPAASETSSKQKKVTVLKALWVFFNQPGWLPEEWWGQEYGPEVFTFDLPRRVIEAAMEAGGAGMEAKWVMAKLEDDAEAKALITRVMSTDPYDDIVSEEDASALFTGLWLDYLEQEQAALKDKATAVADVSEQLSLLAEQREVQKRIRAIKGG